MWSFLHSFRDLLCIPGCSVDELAAAVWQGEASLLLADVHVTLLRLLQADMEEGHAAGDIAVRGRGQGPFFF